MSQSNLKIGPKIKAFRRQLGLQANKLAEELKQKKNLDDLITDSICYKNSNGKIINNKS